MKTTKTFIRFQINRSDDYTFSEAVEYLGITTFTFKRFINAKIINPIEGGGRGRPFYFSINDVESLKTAMQEYFE